MVHLPKIGKFGKLARFGRQYAKRQKIRYPKKRASDSCTDKGYPL